LISVFVAVEKTSDFAKDSVDANDMAEEDVVCLDARDLAV
jgi:hypothetical protein